jgi:Ca-activated chloride channel homolog
MELTLPTPAARIPLLLALATTLFLHSAPLSAQSPPNPAPTAQILFTAVDSTGAPAKTLTKDNIQLQIDKHNVDIQDVLPLTTSPLYFSVLVDVSGSTREFAAAQTTGVIKLFSLFSTDDRNRGYLVPFREDLHPYDQPTSAADVKPAMESFSRAGSTTLYDWLIHVAVKQLATAQLPKNARRAIFVFTDGEDNSSQHSLAETLKILEREGTPVFAILGFSISKESFKTQKQGLETLRSITQATGGSLFFLDKTASIDQAAHAADAQYLLTLTPPQQLKPQKPYPIKLTTSASSIRITAPKEYVAP